jgi:hypothetical protein
VELINNIKESGKKYAAIALATVVVIGGSYWAGRSTAPVQTVVKTEIQWKEKIVEVIKTQIETVTDNHTQTDKEIVKTTTTKPDGTVIVEERYVDKSSSDTRTEETKINDQQTTVSTEGSSTTVAETSTKKPDWHLSSMVGYNLSNLDNPLIGSDRIRYGAQIERRIIWDMYVGVFGTTDKTAGFSVGISL